MKSKIFFFIVILAGFFIQSCSSAKYVHKRTILSIKNTNPTSWSIDACNTIINHYTVTNMEGHYLSNAPVNQSVKIKALPLNKDVITALVRKEIIEKRLPDAKFKENLKEYLEAYTSYTLDTNTSKIILSDSNFTKGYSFKIYMENITNPFKPIFLEDGYSYFFLENMNGNFSRVIEVTGLYAEDFIQLDGYLNVIITFSPFADNGKRLFFSKDLNQSYKLVFNGLQEKPIELKWKTD